MSNGSVLVDIRWEIEEKVSAFQKVLPHHEFLNWADPEVQQMDLSKVRYTVVWKPNPSIWQRLENLEVIFSLGAGVDHIFEQSGIPDLPVVRFVDPDLTGRMVEWVVLQVLMHMRQQRGYDALQRQKNWNELHQPAAYEFRVGMMGFGNLGQACAKVLQALGFKINSWSRSPKSVEGVTSFAGEEQLGSFLKNTDILVGLLPSTPDTQGILNEELINQLATDGPFGAPVLINAGRGASQNEADIIDALKSRKLYGVSLDVFEQEPLPPESELWGFENAVITPHMAAISAPGALANHIAHQIGRYESGQELQYVVDPAQQY